MGSALSDRGFITAAQRYVAHKMWGISRNGKAVWDKSGIEPVEIRGLIVRYICLVISLRPRKVAFEPLLFFACVGKRNSTTMWIQELFFHSCDGLETIQ